jgi:hypothetical protein
MSLSLFEVTKVLQIFDLDVLLVAVAVTALTGLAKLKISEGLKKYVTFFPFIIGALAYGAYTAAFLNIDPFIPRTVTMGIECGVAATIYYVVYEQFIKGRVRAKDTQGGAEAPAGATDGNSCGKPDVTTDGNIEKNPNSEEGFAQAARGDVRDILDTANEIINKLIKK